MVNARSQCRRRRPSGLAGQRKPRLSGAEASGAKWGQETAVVSGTLVWLRQHPSRNSSASSPHGFCAVMPSKPTLAHACVVPGLLEQVETHSRPELRPAFRTGMGATRGLRIAAWHRACVAPAALLGRFLPRLGPLTPVGGLFLSFDPRGPLPLRSRVQAFRVAPSTLGQTTGPRRRARPGARSDYPSR